jgi:hypothetical protein
VFPQVQVTVISLYSGWIPAFMAGSRFPKKAHPVSGVPGVQIKGRASLAAVSRALKRLERAGLSRKGHYPQKLWTTLWTASVAIRRSRR